MLRLSLGMQEPMLSLRCRRFSFSVKMITHDLTSPVVANQFVTCAFFSVKVTTQDLSSLVAANQLATCRRFCLGANDHPGLDKPCRC